MRQAPARQTLAREPTDRIVIAQTSSEQTDAARRRSPFVTRSELRNSRAHLEHQLNDARVRSLGAKATPFDPRLVVEDRADLLRIPRPDFLLWAQSDIYVVDMHIFRHSCRIHVGVIEPSVESLEQPDDSSP